MLTYFQYILPIVTAIFVIADALLSDRDRSHKLKRVGRVAIVGAVLSTLITLVVMGKTNYDDAKKQSFIESHLNDAVNYSKDAVSGAKQASEDIHKAETDLAGQEAAFEKKEASYQVKVEKNLNHQLALQSEVAIASANMGDQIRLENGTLTGVRKTTEMSAETLTDSAMALTDIADPLDNWDYDLFITFDLKQAPFARYRSRLLLMKDKLRRSNFVVSKQINSDGWPKLSDNESNINWLFGDLNNWTFGFDRTPGDVRWFNGATIIRASYDSQAKLPKSPFVTGPTLVFDKNLKTVTYSVNLSKQDVDDSQGTVHGLGTLNGALIDLEASGLYFVKPIDCYMVLQSESTGNIKFVKITNLRYSFPKRGYENVFFGPFQPVYLDVCGKIHVSRASHD